LGNLGVARTAQRQQVSGELVAESAVCEVVNVGGGLATRAKPPPPSECLLSLFAPCRRSKVCVIQVAPLARRGIYGANRHAPLHLTSPLGMNSTSPPNTSSAHSTSYSRWFQMSARMRMLFATRLHRTHTNSSAWTGWGSGSPSSSAMMTAW